MDKLIKSHKFLFLFILITLLVPSGAFGAKLYWVFPDDQIFRGDVFRGKIFLDNEDQSINVLQTEIVFDREKLEILSLETNRSILQLWPRDPSFSNDTGLINLAGGLPNPGFQGKSGLIGTLTLFAKETGKASMNFKQSRLFLNDGLGTEANLETTDSQIVVAVPPSDYTPKSVSPPADIIPPKSFTPVVSQSKHIFDNKLFVTFDASDDESGILYYEVQEALGTKWGEWRRATSPHLLENQNKEVLVFVKALDRAGNERIVKAELQVSKKTILRSIMELIIIGIIILIILYALLRRLLIRKS